MSEEPGTGITTWPAVRDWLRIFDAAKMALHPPKLLLALTALTLTFCWGFMLDELWKVSDHGENAAAIPRFAHPTEAALAGEAAGPRHHGICELWRAHTLTYLQAGLRAAMRLDFYGPDSVWEAGGMLCRGTRWLVSEHMGFAVLFLVGTLAIWSLFGTAVCRIAAVQFAREEKIGLPRALRFAREKFISGFFISPLLPIWIMLFVALLLAIGGAFLWIPAIGNLFALLFPLALVGGLAIAFLLIGCVGGGSFFWPTVAVEGSDGFDAISRSFSYFFGRPVKTVFYGLTALVWGGVCFVVLHFIVWLALWVTHACVSFGMGGFGTGWWGMRPSAGPGMTKLDALWQMPLLTDLYRLGESAHRGGWEVFAAVVIGVSVSVLIGLLWAFLVSYYFCSSTIIYYLLRREVDAADYEDVYLDEEEPTEQAGPTPPPEARGEQTSGTTGVSLPVVPSEPGPPATEEPPPPQW